MSKWARLINDLNDYSCDELALLGLERQYHNGYRYKSAYLYTRDDELFIHVYKNDDLKGEYIEVYGIDWTYPTDEMGEEIRKLEYQRRENDWLIYGQWCVPIEALFKGIEAEKQRRFYEEKKRREAEEERLAAERRKYLSEFEEGFK